VWWDFQWSIHYTFADKSAGKIFLNSKHAVKLQAKKVDCLTGFARLGAVQLKDGRS